MTDRFPEDTERNQKAQLFKPGQSGNPLGRPKGSRNRLATEFVDALADDFSVHGVAAIRKMRETDNTAYVKTVSNVLPKEIIVAALSVNVTAELEHAPEFAKNYNLLLEHARQVIGVRPVIEVESERRDAEYDG